MGMNNLKFYLLAFIIILVMPALTSAADFDPSYLISDSEILDYNSMSQNDIKNFLDKRSGTLNTYLTFDKEGSPKTAVQAFYEISQNWLINPKYLLVLTQKEQSLLESKNPTQKQYDWATGYAVCDNCSMDDPNIQRFKGFYRQVNSAAAQARWDVMGKVIVNGKVTDTECIPTMFNASTCKSNNYLYEPGKTYTISGQQVTIKNSATAALYKYTPHVSGNKLFWNLWNKYFEKKWPDGTLLQAEGSDDVYYIENNLKRLVASKAVMASRFNAKQIIGVSPADVDLYETGAPIKYINFSLLQSKSGGDIYMIINDSKRRIAGEALFKKLGFNEDDITKVDDAELKLYKDSNDITEYTMHPTGIIVQDSKAKSPFEKLYYVISGEKRPILAKEIFDANFSGLKIKKVTAAELDLYMTGNNVSLPDGWLIKSPKSPAVFVISNGKRLPIQNAKIFYSMNYDIKNVKTISESAINAIEIGQMITGQW